MRRAPHLPSAPERIYMPDVKPTEPTRATVRCPRRITAIFVSVPEVQTLQRHDLCDAHIPETRFIIPVAKVQLGSFQLSLSFSINDRPDSGSDKLPLLQCDAGRAVDFSDQVDVRLTQDKHNGILGNKSGRLSCTSGVCIHYRQGHNMHCYQHPHILSLICVCRAATTLPNG